MKLSRRNFVKTAAAGAPLFFFRGQSAQPKTPPPNVIFILADDLGWGDLSCYGRPDYRTPNIDLLASQGTKLLMLMRLPRFALRLVAALSPGAIPPGSRLD